MRRSTLSIENGIGDALVSFDGTSLGQLRPGGLGGADAEVIQDFLFDVTSLVNTGTNGLLTVSVDGTGISGGSASDIFAVDYVQFMAEGDSISADVPLAPTWLLGLAGLAPFRKRLSQPSSKRRPRQ